MEVIIAHMYISPMRRALGVVLQGVLGLGFILIAATQPLASPVYTVLLMAIGALALFGGWRFWQATTKGIVLTDLCLRETSGRIICQLDEIDRIERGTFAFKPANGFTLRMTTRQRRGWAPGLWWRMGKMVGIGGATNRNAAKAMADAIDVLRGPHAADLIAQARTEQPTP